MYSDTTPNDGYYEEQIGFYWDDDQKPDEPQGFTIDFQLSDEMEDDYPHSIENEENLSFEEGTKRREEWVAHNIDILLEFGFVIEVYGHEEIESVSDLETLLPEMNFKLFYY